MGVLAPPSFRSWLTTARSVIGQDRLVQEVMAERVHLAEALRRGIATDEECWDRGAQALAQLADRDEAVLSAEQVVVGDNQIGHTRKASQTCKSFAHRCDADYLASPTCQQLAGAVQDQAVVVDHDDDLAGHRISRYPEAAHGQVCLPSGRRQRHREHEARALAHFRPYLDRMVEQPAQALDDGQSKTQSARSCLTWPCQPSELAKDCLLLVFGDADAAVHDLDAAGGPHAAGSRRPRRRAPCI